MNVYVIELVIKNEDLDWASGYLFKNLATSLIETDLGQGKTKLEVSFNAENKNLDGLLDEIAKNLPCLETPIGKTVNPNDIQFKPKPFDPIEIAKGVWIIPPADMETTTKPGEGKTIIIRPGAAFGTGRHESTQLSTEAISEVYVSYKSNTTHQPNFLDIGTGSGVLAIHAFQLGFNPVVAVEIDEMSRVNALENFEHNGASTIFLLEDLSLVCDNFNVIVANIITPVHLELNLQMKARLKPAGFLILSGIVTGEASQIEQAFLDLEIVSKKQKNEWLCYILRKKG